MVAARGGDEAAAHRFLGQRAQLRHGAARLERARRIQALVLDEELREAEALAVAADQLSAAFPTGDVGRYFWTLLWQDPETWGALQDRPELAGLV